MQFCSVENFHVASYFKTAVVNFGTSHTLSKKVSLNMKLQKVTTRWRNNK